MINCKIIDGIFFTYHSFHYTWKESFCQELSLIKGSNEIYKKKIISNTDRESIIYSKD